ncbi:hypothetical protein CAL7716_101650 (plasmid) [Calothrix sp. PCC 7716]|nr:hypothetical protein CAL7716_101650 [Calothrix sp. PCC 7716]
MENSPEEIKSSEHTNINLIHSYTDYRVKLANDSINALNTKLASIIAFSGASISFSINLPNKPFILSEATQQYLCYTCLILKILVCICLVIAICISTLGFLPKSGGGMTPPNLLMSENYYDSDENIRLIITKTEIEALEELESIRDDKAKLVTKAILALASGAILAASSIILASILSML